MKLNDFGFEMEVLSKTEFVDDYTFNNKKYLVTIWNVHLSREAVNDYLTNYHRQKDEFTSQEEYDKSKIAYEKWVENFKRLLGQEDENITITQAQSEFFTAVKIDKMIKIK